MKMIIYPGSFDPITCGHLDLIERAARMTDNLVVAVLHNGNKQGFFTIPERVEMIKKCKFSLALIPYLGVISYTMVLRTDLNAFLNPFIEIICLYLMIYVIRYELGIEKTINIVCIFQFSTCTKFSIFY